MDLDFAAAVNESFAFSISHNGQSKQNLSKNEQKRSPRPVSSPKPALHNLATNARLYISRQVQPVLLREPSPNLEPCSKPTRSHVVIATRYHVVITTSAESTLFSFSGRKNALLIILLTHQKSQRSWRASTWGSDETDMTACVLLQQFGDDASGNGGSPIPQREPTQLLEDGVFFEAHRSRRLHFDQGVVALKVNQCKCCSFAKRSVRGSGFRESGRLDYQARSQIWSFFGGIIFLGGQDLLFSHVPLKKFRRTTQIWGTLLPVSMGLSGCLWAWVQPEVELSLRLHNTI